MWRQCPMPPLKHWDWFANSRRGRAQWMASTCASSPARSTASSARTGRGSRPRSTCSPPCSRQRRGGGGEAAPDPSLTGREHMKLQTALHGMRGADARERSETLLARVGLTQAADRRVGGYSGGMKRRLDLALALVHRPRILFLDEPTTGLDPQSRSALWEEVSRLAREDGVTVFLTTQYLEEADVLADRVGITDHGHIVAEDTPEALKAEIGLPSVHATPAEERDRQRLVSALAPYGESLDGGGRDVVVRLREGLAGLPSVVRAVDNAGLTLASLEIQAPSLDDVFLAKTGRSLEGAAEAEAEAEAEPEAAE